MAKAHDCDANPTSPNVLATVIGIYLLCNAPITPDITNKLDDVNPNIEANSFDLVPLSLNIIFGSIVMIPDKPIPAKNKRSIIKLFT